MVAAEFGGKDGGLVPEAGVAAAVTKACGRRDMLLLTSGVAVWLLVGRSSGSTYGWGPWTKQGASLLPCPAGGWRGGGAIGVGGLVEEQL
jgi:hypothetical protein